MPPAPRSSSAPPPTAPVAPRIVRVRATRAGFYGGSRRRSGDEFALTLPPSGALPSWVEPVATVPEG